MIIFVGKVTRDIYFTSKFLAYFTATLWLAPWLGANFSQVRTFLSLKSPDRRVLLLILPSIHGSMSQRYPSHPPPDPSTIHPSVLIKPRALAPLREPPLFSSILPQLPCPIRNPSFNSSYKLTTHLYPSAYPHAPSSPLPRASYADIPGETKPARIARQKALLQELWLRNHTEATNGGRRNSEPEVLWNVVNRFVRKDIGEKHKKGGLTLFLAHANGFHKEVCSRVIKTKNISLIDTSPPSNTQTWEPFLREMLSYAQVAGIIIQEVWAFESVQHGDSALLNDNIIGDVCASSFLAPKSAIDSANLKPS